MFGWKLWKMNAKAGGKTSVHGIVGHIVHGYYMPCHVNDLCSA